MRELSPLVIWIILILSITLLYKERSFWLFIGAPRLIRNILHHTVSNCVMIGPQLHSYDVGSNMDRHLDRHVDGHMDGDARCLFRYI